MRVVIVGAGGLGCKFGAMLGEHAEVILVHHKRKHVDKINENNGVFIKTKGAKRLVKVHAAKDTNNIGLADLILILVKSYDMENAARSILPIVSENTLVFTMQNGLGNLEKIKRIIGGEQTLLGVTFQGATLISPGYTEDKGQGDTYLSYKKDNKGRVEKIVDLFNKSGICADMVKNVDSVLWAKLCVTAGINSVAAVLQISNGILGSIPEAREISIAAIKETMKIAEKKGITLSFDPIERFDMVTEATYNMYSGTLLDILKGHCSEIDAISGGIVKEGQVIGVNTPVHSMLWQIVKALQATHKHRIMER